MHASIPEHKSTAPHGDAGLGAFIWTAVVMGTEVDGRSSDSFTSSWPGATDERSSRRITDHEIVFFSPSGQDSDVLSG